MTKTLDGLSQPPEWIRRFLALKIGLVHHFLEPPMKTLVARFARDESAATALEYGLIAAGISIVIILSVNTIGNNLINVFNNVAANLK